MEPPGEHWHRSWAGSGPARVSDGTNPLRHGVDRAQTWAGRALVILTALLLPVAAAAAGTAAYHASMHTVHVQTANRHHVVATTTANAPRPFNAVRVPVPVRIAGAAHPAYQATARVAPGTRAGTAVTVWIDNRSGRVVPAPKSQSASAHDAIWAGAAAGLVTGGLAWLLWLLLRRTADWWRLARWQTEWRRVEPTWSARRTRSR